MLDAVDAVIKSHIQNLFAVDGKSLPVFAIGTADQDDQSYSQAGMDSTSGKKQDTVSFPFASLTRLPNIDITDDNMTKRVHTYTGYKLNGTDINLTYYRCTLHYVVTIFAENRKVSEDLATALYGRLRNYCQISALIRLPIELDENKYAAAQMDSDIVLGPTIEQLSPLAYDKAQVYKCRISFDVQNVNVYHTITERRYKYNIFVQGSLEDDISPKGQLEQIFSSDDE